MSLRRRTLWARLQKAGLAGEVADAIVKTQPVPERLLRVLATPGSPFALSAAETDVLDDAAAGLTTGESARKRGTSVETVKRQRRQVIAKLHAANMTHAVAIHVSRNRAA